MSSCRGQADDSARYVTQRMSQLETLAFEEHLVGCRACQVEVKLSAVLQRQLADHKVKSPPRFHIRFARGTVIGTLALAAGLVFMITRISPGANPYEELGSVVSPPPYGGVGVRSTETSGDALFATAMAAYRDGNYSVAATGLRAAREAGVDSGVTTFFLGVAHLLGDDRTTARAELSSAAAMPNSLYAAEAHYYLAKLLLRAGEPDAALRHLHIASRSTSLTRRAAQALADSVQEIHRR